MWFVILPLLIYLILGTVILLIGYYSLCGIRRDIKQEGRDREVRNLDILIRKIGKSFIFILDIATLFTIAKNLTRLLKLNIICNCWWKYLLRTNNVSFSGTFSCLYIIPAIIFVICLFYEYFHLPIWMQTWQETICRNERFRAIWQPPCRYPDGEFEGQEAPLELFLIKYLSVICIAFFSGSWVWSNKTLSVWKKCSKNMTASSKEQNVWSVD